MSEWVVEKLNVKHHDRAVFDCGLDVLNHYLRTRANQEQTKRLNVTYVLCPSDAAKPKSILAYYTMSNSAMARSVASDGLRKGVPLTYAIPSVKIGRLAVDHRHQSKGLGAYLLKDAMCRIVEVATFSGVRCIEVVAKNDQMADFYKQYGFASLQNQPHYLFLPVESAVRALSSLYSSDS